MDTESIVRRVVKRCGTNNPFEICELYHIIVQEWPLVNTYGFHMYTVHQHVITINDALSDEWKRFTCSHELGHVFLHDRTSTSWVRRYTGYSVRKIEHQADDFAARLLSYGIEPEEGMTLQQYAALCGIPVDRAEMLLKK